MDLKFAKVDADENKNLADLYEIGSYPTLTFFKDGQHYDFSGTCKYLIFSELKGYCQLVKEKNGILIKSCRILKRN